MSYDSKGKCHRCKGSGSVPVYVCKECGDPMVDGEDLEVDEIEACCYTCEGDVMVFISEDGQCRTCMGNGWL